MNLASYIDLYVSHPLRSCCLMHTVLQKEERPPQDLQKSNASQLMVTGTVNI
jgi:hypothetical protein